MFEKPSPHFSFIVRCWRDETASVQGWLVDAYTGQAHRFHSVPGLVQCIEGLLSAHPVVGEEDLPDVSGIVGTKGGRQKSTL